jgi:hypothetical protein
VKRSRHGPNVVHIVLQGRSRAGGYDADPRHVPRSKRARLQRDSNPYGSSARVRAGVSGPRTELSAETYGLSYYRAPSWRRR